MSKSLAAYTVGMSFCEKGLTDLHQQAKTISPVLDGTSFGQASIAELLMMSSGAYNWSLDTHSGTIKDEWNNVFEYRAKTIPEILKSFDATPKNSGTFAYKNSDTNALPFYLATQRNF